MGKFTNNVERKRKHKMSVLVPVTIDDSDLDLMQSIIEAAPDSVSADVKSISNSSGIADVDVTYEARGANKTDVTKRLKNGGLTFVTKRTKTTVICGCENKSTNANCEED